MSLTSCIKKAGDSLQNLDKLQVLDLAAANRRAGMDADAAARAAVDQVLANVQAELDAHLGTPAAAPSPAPQPAGPRFKVGDLIVVRDRFKPTDPGVIVAVKKVTVLPGPGGGTIYNYINPSFTGVQVEDGAVEADVEAAPAGTQATPQKADTAGKPAAALARARQSADSTLQGLRGQADQAGAEKLSATLQTLRVSTGQANDRGVPPAYVRTLAERMPQLLERAKANPTDDFMDIRLGNAPSTKVMTPEEANAAKVKRLETLAKIAKVVGPPKASEPEPSYGGAPAPAPMLTREQEAELLPLLAELLDTAVMEGHKSFRAAAQQALGYLEDALGHDVANAFSIKHLQGAYISMSARYGEGEVDDMATVAQFKTKDQLKETSDAADPAGDVESDRPAGDEPVAPPVLDGQAGDQGRDGQPGRAPRSPGGRPGSAPGVSGGRAPAAGAAGDPGLFGDEPDAPAGSADDERSADDGDAGAPADSLTDEGVEEAARRATADRLKRSAAQREAESLPVITGDLANIRETLPMLLPEQQGDVHFAEQRFAKEDGYGVLFTNGTGTGKTFTGLGIIKRYARLGKRRILVVVPDQEIMTGWVRSGPMLGLTVTQLKDTTDAGANIVVTTYANVRDNNELVKSQWDLVVADEAHEMGSGKDGEITEAGDRIRVFTMHPAAVRARTRMLHPELAAKIDDLQARYEKALKEKNNLLAGQLRGALEEPLSEFRGHQQVVQQEVDAAQGLKRPRAVFLSATPFAYEVNVQWAQGYLFDWAKGYDPDNRRGLSPYQSFMVENFGWRLRYGKLTQPDETKVNRGVMQRAFNTRLRAEGVLRGRAIDSDFDYDRRFVAANSDIGRRIDEGFEWFWDTKPGELANLPVEEDGGEYEAVVRSAMLKVWGALRSRFDYLTRLRMLEAMKAQAAIPYIRAHMAQGRKVVVFHDLIKGQALDPFGVSFDPEESPLEAAILERWQTEFSELMDFDWNGLKSPIEAFRLAFGEQMRELNGQTVNKRQRRENVDALNDDSVGPMVLLVQSDKDKGWSGHDTTGKHPRVLINLGLPLRPTKAIQQEGRIFRVGQLSNAMFRYFNTQTRWELEAFAAQMSRRASTAENLAMGEEARGLLQAYVGAFQETGEWLPGHEGEGVGGKAGDRALAQLLTPFDLAKTLYWAKLKKTAATKAEEGADYFPTPEPLGLKMVEWADLRGGENFIEPSAGDGAIARWAPDNVERLAIEPSPRLAPKLQLAFGGKVRMQRFEDLAVVNKADGIVMNPPFNKPGAKGAGLAFEHLAKAYNDHLEVGGRLVALLPEGPAADARLDKFLTGKHDRPLKPVFEHLTLGAIYKGDTVAFRGSSGATYVVTGLSPNGDALRLHTPGTSSERDTYLRAASIDAVTAKAPRVETAPNSEGAHIVATVRLPTDTFGRAGTNVRTRIVIIDKLGRDQVGPARVDYDFSQLDKVEELFDEIEQLGIPERTKPRPADVDDDAQAQPEEDTKKPEPAKPAGQTKKEAKVSAENEGEALAKSHNLKIIEHTSAKGNQSRGVILQHVGVPPLKAGPAPYAFKKDGGTYVNLKNLKDALEAFPLPPTAAEERAVYAVREPDANYDVDLFGNPVPTPARRGSSHRRPAPVQHVQPATTLSVRADQALPGVYRVTTQLVEVGRRTLPVAAVRNWHDAAAALSSLTRYAVEHLDALVTDASGRPLAIVGSFKGAIASTVAYPETVLAEALRIEGAAAIWAVHNHPSGYEELSDSDFRLSGMTAKAFAPSRVKFMGVAAVGTDGNDVRYMAHVPAADGYQRDSVRGIVVPGSVSSTVPIVERTITAAGRRGTKIDSPATAKGEVAQLMATDRRPGLLLMNTQQDVVGWMPLAQEDVRAMAGNGRFDQLINAVMGVNARGVIIANPNDAFGPRILDNIASALNLADVRVLDVIDTVQGTSAAERGLTPNIGLPVLNGIEGPVTPGGVPMRELQAAVRDATLMWDTSPGMPRVVVVATAAGLPVDIQRMLEDMRALTTTRGLMMPDGRVYLVADRINNAAEGQAVLFHEVYGHFGLRAFLGQDSYDTQMGLLRMANPRLAAEANTWFAAYGQDQINARVLNGMPRDEAGRAVRALAVEEALADRAGLHESPKNWKLLMARLQKALRSWGWDGIANLLERMTEAETHALLMSARQVLHGQAPHANTISAELGGAMGRAGPQSRADQTQAPAFRRWFGGSKVVDADGRPLVVYHGTKAEFTEFKRTRSGEFGPGIYLTTNPREASEYGDGKGWGGSSGTAVMPLFAAIRNPYTKGVEAFWQEFGRTDGDAAAVSRAEAAGYDGVVATRPDRYYDNAAREYVDRGDMLTHYVAFQPEQVKSAIGNIGAFDPTSPSILLSQVPSPAAPPAIQPSSAPLDAAVRIPMTPIAKLTSAGYTLVLEIADRGLSVFGDAYEYAKAGLVDQYGLDPAHTDQKIAMKTAIRVGARKTNEIVDKLRALDQAQSRIAYLWMTSNPDNPHAEQAMLEAAALFDQLPEEPRLVLASLKADIEHLSDEAVKYGLLSHDVRERHAMAYMHRSYQRYEHTDAGAAVARARAIKVLGEQFKGRGMRHDAGMAQIAESDWWQRKTNGQAHDPSLKGQRFFRLEQRKTPDGATGQLFEDENGQPLGRLQQVVYWPEDEPIPRQYADWRNDGVWEARFFNKGGKVGMWRDFTLAERTKLGEIQEIKYATAVTMMQMVRDVETARFLDWVARNEAVLDESQLPEGAEAVEASLSLGRSFLAREWVQVPDSAIPGTGVKRYANLAGRWVPGPVWNDLRQISELADQNDLSRLYQAMMRAWKVSKTALSPVTHMNNVMSNFMLADMHDIQARHLYQALRAMLEHKTDPAARRLLEDFQDHGGDAGMFNEAEIREELFRPLLDELRKEIEADSGQALVMAAQVVDLLRARQFRQAWAAASQSKRVMAQAGAVAGGAVGAALAGPAGAVMGATVGAAAPWVGKKLIKLYGLEDELFRLAAFVKARADGVTDAEAGKFARESFLNYDINAPWVNALRRTALPFIAFTYRAAPMLARTFADKPHKLLKYTLLAAALNALAYAALGDDGDEERERALMADEKAGRIWGFMTPKLMRMPWNDHNGSPVFLDIRRWIPAGDIVDIGQSQSMIPLPPGVVPGGPLMLLGEFMLNSSGFTGNDIVKRTDDWDERLAKSADWLWKGVMPNFPGLPGTYSTDALVDAYNGRVAAGPFGQEKAGPGQAIVSAVGIKVGSYPIEQLDHNARSKAGAEIAEIKSGLRKDVGAVQRSGLDDATQDADVEQLQSRAGKKLGEVAAELSEKRRRAGLQD